MADEKIFKKDFIKNIDLNKVTEGFEEVSSFEELLRDRIFKNLFLSIAEEANIEDEIEEVEEGFITSFCKDAYLLSQWYRHLESKGKTQNFIERKVDRMACFYVTLLQYVGEYLYEINSGMREVLEIWIIKGGISPKEIKTLTRTYRDFYEFLSNKIPVSMPLDEEEVEDLQRVAHEFGAHVWEEKGEDYLDWRERNIIYYF